jgi:hypothetical protein
VKVTLDINVFLDVLQKREPHYAASAQVVGLVTSGISPARRSRRSRRRIF